MNFKIEQKRIVPSREIPLKGFDAIFFSPTPPLKTLTILSCIIGMKYERTHRAPVNTRRSSSKTGQNIEWTSTHVQRAVTLTIIGWMIFIPSRGMEWRFNPSTSPRKKSCTKTGFGVQSRALLQSRFGNNSPGFDE